MLARPFSWLCLGSLVICLVISGCDDLREFKTGPHTVFRGEVVGSDSNPKQSSFIRTGFASHTRMEFSFDPYANSIPAGADAAKDDRAESPGRVHTYVCPAGRPACDAPEGSVGPFDQARLQPIENLTHDSLSEYTFPGGGRLRNYMFGVRFESALEQGSSARNAMLFVSLMDSGQIEVRAIALSVLAPDGETELLPALFGVFVLDRQPQ